MTHVPASVGPQPYPYLEFLPQYDASTVARTTQNLLDLYRQTENELRRQWSLIVNDPLADNARARVSNLLASLERSKTNVDASVSEWIRTTYPAQYAFGAQRMAEGYDSVPFQWSAPHRDAAGLLANDTFDSLLRSTSYEPDQIKATVRELARTATAQAVLGGQTATGAGRQLARQLEAQGVMGVTYADGKFVGASSYADMVVRTRSAIAYNAGGLNQARADGVEYFEISDGLECGLTSHDDEELADGMIVDGDIAAQFPISHPNCVRSFLPRPDLAAEQVDKLSTDPENTDLSLVSTQSRDDQQAFDAYLIDQGKTHGLTYTQAAAKFGRAERAQRAPRVEREPRTPRVPRAQRGLAAVPTPAPAAVAAPPAAPPAPAPIAPTTTPSGIPLDQPITGKTITEIEASFREKWGTMVDGGDRVIALTKFGKDGARLVAETLDEQFRKYPKIAERTRFVGSITEMGQALGRRKMGQSIGLANSRGLLGWQQTWMKANEETMTARTARNGDAGFWSTSDPRHVIVHEFGHLVGYSGEGIFNTQPPTTLDEWYGSKLQSSAGNNAANDLHAYLAREVEAEIGVSNPMNYRNIEAELSKYGATDVRETCAEAWAEYQIKGETARPFARAIAHALERLMDQMPDLPPNP